MSSRKTRREKTVGRIMHRWDNIKMWLSISNIKINLMFIGPCIIYREEKLIPEQYPGETNPLFQMAINPQPPHTT